MDELIAPDDDADMRGARVGRGEEHQVSRREFSGIDLMACVELLTDIAWQRQTVTREDVLRKSAAIEAIRVGAAVPVAAAAEG